MTATRATILLLASNGQLGSELAQSLDTEGTLVTSSRNGGDHPCDLSRFDHVSKLLTEIEPDHIVNASAYTAVDRAEEEPDAAFHLNRDLPALLAGHLKPTNGLLMHYSTDYVFAGTASRPYGETDPTAPVNVYGQSKLAGELAVAESGCRHLIFRTAWVYGRFGNNFVKTISKLAQQRDNLAIVDDQMGRPVSAQHLARASTLAFKRALQQSISGTFHLSANGDPVSWYGFAQRFIQWQSRQNTGTRWADLKPVDSSQFPTPASRPNYSLLDNSLFEKTFGVDVVDWHEQLEQTLPTMGLC